MSENIGAVGTAAIETSSAPAEAVQPAKAEASAQEKAPLKAAPQPAAEPKRYKLKVDGREEEVDESEVVRRAQVGSAAHKRFEETAKVRENVAKLMQTLKDNPIAALMDPALGLTKDQVKAAFEQWYKREVIDPEMLTPEQRKLREYEAKEKQWKQAEEEKAKHEQSQKLQAEAQHWKGEYEKQIIKGLDTKGLPRNASTVRAMAAYMEQANKAGIDVPIETIAGLVHQDKTADTKHILSSMEGEQLIAFVGEEIINKIRKADLARLRGGNAKPAAQSPNAAAVAQSSEPNRGQGKPISMKEARKYFDSIK